jgi:FixJ family two-component response regulator
MAGFFCALLENRRKFLSAFPGQPGIMVSDISIPLMNGTDLCKKIKKMSVPGSYL